MARPKAFDRDDALDKAIAVFSDHGYEGSSTEALLDAMAIGRQSLYDTFGDKRRLYLEALQRYNAESVSDLIANLDGTASPLAGVRAMLERFAERPQPKQAVGCLGVSAICEFGRSDPEIALIGDAAGRVLTAALEKRIAAARDAGEVDAAVEPKSAARFLAATLAGMKIAARDGANVEALRDIARMALRSLH